VNPVDRLLANLGTLPVVIVHSPQDDGGALLCDERDRTIGRLARGTEEAQDLLVWGPEAIRVLRARLAAAEQERDEAQGRASHLRFQLGQALRRSDDALARAAAAEERAAKAEGENARITADIERVLNDARWRVVGRDVLYAVAAALRGSRS
jgi:hypothetical protein